VAVTLLQAAMAVDEVLVLAGTVAGVLTVVVA
jgi:hypothetical protein